MHLDTLRHKTLTAVLATTFEDDAARAGPHPGAKTMLTLARALGWLKGSFHTVGNL